MENTIVNTIRVDSRFRVSGSPTDFKYVLPYTIGFPDDTVAYVSAVSFPNSWYNVDADISDRLYVIETRTVGGVSQKRCRALQIPAGQYTSLTLPTAIALALNTNSSLTGMAYQVDYLPSRGTLRVQLTTAPGGTTDASARFQLPSEDEMANASWSGANWTGVADAYDLSNPDAMTDLLRLPTTSAPTTLLETGLLNVAPIDCVYLHSNLCNFDTLGPRDTTDCIQRVPVTVSYGFQNHYLSNGSTEESFNVTGTYRVLEFRLCTVRGRVVDLHGGQMSVEIVFQRKNRLL